MPVLHRKSVKNENGPLRGVTTHSVELQEKRQKFTIEDAGGYSPGCDRLCHCIAVSGIGIIPQMSGSALSIADAIC